MDAVNENLASALTSNDTVIRAPEEWRALLMATAVGVLEQRVNVSQANAVASLSTEVHKSIRQEFDMRCYVAENLRLVKGKIVLEGDEEQLETADSANATTVAEDAVVGGDVKVHVGRSNDSAE